MATTVSGEVKSQLLPILTPVSDHSNFTIDFYLMIRVERNQASPRVFLRTKVRRE
jgi:hypothetical protein